MLKAVEARMVSKCSGLIQASESRIMEKVDLNDQSNELRIKSQSSTFNDEVKYFRRIAKEIHVMFVQDVKKVREDVNFKLQELREDMEKEIEVVQRGYASLNQQVDIIDEVVTKVESFNIEVQFFSIDKS
ncbi:unnamed protein product [Lactuca saligna]|uniref:Uncharacterized protein n=1 Tax=Lactuca saligna TaxID=75948 RepID=A0AA35ZXD4_LACSI|nr:unnamed protein product [Lactuca saligna]